MEEEGREIAAMFENQEQSGVGRANP